MSVPAGQQHTSRDGVSIFGWEFTVRPPATSMYETSRLWAIGVLFQLEQAIVVRRQQPALHAAQPAREGTNWYADPGFGGEPVGGFALAERCHA